MEGWVGSGLGVSHRSFAAQWPLPRALEEHKTGTDGSLRMMAEPRPLPQRVTCDRMAGKLFAVCPA